MNIIEKIESEIHWDKKVDEQLDTLSQFENLSDEEIIYIAENGHKSSEVGILLSYLGHGKLHNYLNKFLVFLQDINWPAAGGAGKMLLDSGEEILPEIRRIFKEENDDIWKYWILCFLIEDWPEVSIKKLKYELILIAENESKFEKSGVAIKALLILRKYELISKEEGLKHYKSIESGYLADRLNDWKEELFELQCACN